MDPPPTLRMEETQQPLLSGQNSRAPLDLVNVWVDSKIQPTAQTRKKQHSLKKAVSKRDCTPVVFTKPLAPPLMQADFRRNTSVNLYASASEKPEDALPRRQRRPVLQNYQTADRFPP